VWESRPSDIKSGYWCRKCGLVLAANKLRASIEDMKELAREKGGNCISENYINSQTKLKWQCKEGHVWEAKPNSISMGEWCPYCSKNVKLTIEEMQSLAQERGGECLSTEYINIKTKLKWRCEKGHEWEATPRVINYDGCWCPKCGMAKRAENAKLSIYHMQGKAKLRGGKCLSEKYLGTKSKLKWQCREGHEWEATPDTIRNSWCPECSPGLRERICRALFEHLFETEFPKTKPDWLLNPEGNLMELDGYSERLKIAFEYQGAQHYHENPFFHRDETLGKRIDDDNEKRRLCLEHNVILMEIPYSVAYKDIEEYIYLECIMKGIKVSRKEKANLAELGVYSFNRIEDMRYLAQSRGGQCLSEEYIHSQTKLKWRCEKGHEWEATPNSVASGRWCRKCAISKVADAQRLSIDEINGLAQAKGGQCLSEVYIDSKTKLVYRCEKGHEWKATPSSIKNGSWCPQCAGKARLTINDMRQIAEERGGECLSEEMVSSYSNLRWRCKEGHEWEARPNIVKSGTWCPFCAGTARLTISDMQQLAQSKGGSCISTEYINSKKKLKWRCVNGHKWDATPHDIKQGAWCPICINERRKDDWLK